MSSLSSAAARTSERGSPVRLSRLGDELLARQAARGNERAFSVLYERYSQPLYRYCRSIVRHDADAQDALQATFTNALAALRRGGRNAPVRPWLYRIAHNESVSALRRRKRDTQSPLVADSPLLGASAEEEAAGRARWRGLVEDLAQLPERQRGALLLRELAGLSHEEIGLSLGLSVGAAKQAIFEARQGLAEVEEGRSMSCEEIRRRISAGDRRVLRGRRVRSHLRDCAACGDFAVAISSRQSDLRALTPGLPPAAAAAVLGRVIQAASSHGAAPAGSAAMTGAAGKAAGILGWKSLAAVGLAAGTAAGVTGLAHIVHHARAAAHPVLRARAHESHLTGRPLVSGRAQHVTAPPGRSKPSHDAPSHRASAPAARPHRAGSATPPAPAQAPASTLSSTGSRSRAVRAQGSPMAGHPRHAAGSHKTATVSHSHGSVGGTGNRSHSHRVPSSNPKPVSHGPSRKKISPSAPNNVAAPKAGGTRNGVAVPNAAGAPNTAASK